MKLKVFFTLLLLVNISLISFSQQKKIDVTYIANCGFLLETNGKQLVIDALFKEGFHNYLVTPDSIAARIITSQKPFNNVHLMLITHNHEDHFNDSLVVKYLNYNPDNILIAPPLVAQTILKHPDYKKSKNQIVELDKVNQDKNDTIIQGIRIRSFFIQHDNRPEIENVGYLIDMDGIKIFHTGDCTGADTLQIKNLQLQNKDIDLAFLNYYGFWRYKKSRDFLKENINPKEIVLMHIPPHEVESVKNSVNKISDFIDINVFDNSMNKKSFNFNHY
jgi:L-ascorbate metabolism protein UlaG (beta-lactamase superfamily)